MRSIFTLITILFLLLSTACVSISKMDETDPETFAYLVSLSPYKNLEDPAYVALPKLLRVKDGSDVFNIDKVGLDPNGNALYVDKKRSLVVLGEGLLYPTYDQNGCFTGILNGNSQTINLVTDEKFPQELIQKNVTILFYQTSTNKWIKIVEEAEKSQ